MSLSAGTVQASLTLDRSNFSAGLRTAGQEVTAFSRQTESASSGAGKLASSFSSAGKTLMTVGGAMTVGVTVPLMGIGAAATKMAMDFEDTMAKVSTLVSSTGVKDKLSKDILAMSGQLGLDANQVGEAIYQGLSSGVSEDNITKFTEQMGKLAKGGFTNIETAADAATSVINAYGLSIDDASRVSDVFITTQNRGKIVVDQLASQIGRVLPTASAYGVSIEQVGAAYALMTARGVQAEQTTTYFNSMLGEMGKSGTEAAKVIKQLSGKSFAELISSGKSVGDVLAMMDEYAKKNNKTLKDLFGSSEAGSAALLLASEAGAAFNKELGYMQNSAGETEKAFQKVSNTANEKFKKAIEGLKSSAIELGNKLLPTVTKIIESFGKLVDKFNNLSDAQKDNILKWGMIAAAAGPVIGILGGVFSAIGKIISVGSSLGGILTSVTGGMGTLSAASSVAAGATGIGGVATAGTGLMTVLGGLLNPIVLVTAGIAAIGTALYLNNKKIQESTEEYKNIGTGLDDFQGKLRTTEGVISRVFGQNYELKFSQSFHEQKNRVNQEADEITTRAQQLKSDIEAILNSDLNKNDMATQIREKYDEELKAQQEYWFSFNQNAEQNQSYNKQQYAQYLRDTFKLDEESIQQQTKAYSEHFDDIQVKVSKNEKEMLAIKQQARDQARELTATEEQKINELLEENKGYREQLVKLEGEDVYQSIQKNMLDRKALYDEDLKNVTEADLKKQQSMLDYDKAMKDSYAKRAATINADMTLTQEQKTQAINALEQEKSAHGLFTQNIVGNNQVLMSSGKTFAEANAESMRKFVNGLLNGSINAESFGTTTEGAMAMALEGMVAADVGADNLKQAILAIPEEKRAEVLAQVKGKENIDAVRNAINNLPTYKQVTVGVVTTGNGTKYWNGSTMYATGTDNALPGVASVAEYGAELIQSRSGALTIATGRQLFNMEGGETVYNARQTQEILSGMNTRQGDTKGLEKVVAELGNVLSKNIKDLSDRVERVKAGVNVTVENFNNNNDRDIESLADDLAFHIQRKLAF